MPPEIDPVISEAMTSLGIDASTYDDGSLEVEKLIQSAEAGEAAAPEEAKEGEEVAETNESGEEVEKPEGEEKTEAPIEEPKLTAKEFQEIELKEQALATREKLFQEGVAAKEKEFEEASAKIKDHDLFDEFLSYYVEEDPDMFKLLQEDFNKFRKQYAHPIVDKVSKEVAEMKKELSQFKAKASDEVTRTKLDSEISAVKASIGKEAEAAGIKIDYTAVEDVWADNPKLSFEEAVWAKYGATLAKAQASKAKVVQTEKKLGTQPAAPTSGILNRSTKTNPFNHKTASWDESVMEAVRAVVGH